MVYLSLIPLSLGIIMLIYVIYTVSSRRDKNMNSNRFTVSRLPAYFLLIMPFALFIYAFVIFFLYIMEPMLQIEELPAIIPIALCIISVFTLPLIISMTRWRLVFDRDIVHFVDLLASAKTYRVTEMTILPAVEQNATKGGDPAYNVKLGKKSMLILPRNQGYKLFFDKFIKVKTNNDAD